MSKIVTALEAASQIHDGDILMLGGFGSRGFAAEIVGALCRDTNVRNLTIYVNSPNERTRPDLEELLSTRCRHVKCTFMRSSAATKLYEEGKLEIIPQGNFSESLRMGGSGVPAYYTPVGIGTPVEKGKEIREFNGRKYLLEHSLTGDVALLRANVVDKMGNCFIKGATKNFSPAMAMACRKVFVEAEKLVEIGEIAPEDVTIPGIIINGIVEVNQSYGM